MSTTPTEAPVNDGSTITVPVPPPAPAAPQTFSAEDIERARQQEKDKVYGRLEEQERIARETREQLAALQAAKDAEVQAAAEQAAREAQEKARQEWEEKGAKDLLAQAQQTWEEKFQALQAEREQERAAFAKEQEFANLRAYTQNKVQAAVAAGEVAPEMADFVSGNNQQEIDASLDFVKARTAELVNNIRQAQEQARAAMPGVAPSGYAPTGPMETQGSTRTLSAADIANMSMADYAKARGTLLPAASQAQQGRGLYG
jgi:hypothetical protein